MKKMTKEEVIKTYDKYVWDHPASLRYRARLAYLDGRSAFAEEMYRRAHILEKHLKERKGQDHASTS